MSIGEFYQDFFISEDALDEVLEEYVDHYLHHELPIHRTEAGYPRCATCDGGGCYDCTDAA